MTNTLRGADIVARSLQRLGCRRVYTLSGNHIMSIFDAALDAGLDLVHVRHEAAAVHMADAHGRLTGEAGVALVTGGPGHANAVGALYTALAAESPMVLLSGHAATWELGRGGFQELRQADMAAPVTKASWMAASVESLGRDIGEAFRLALSGRRGPVHISLPSDLLDARMAESAVMWPANVPIERAALADAACDEILALLAAAENPMIFAGPQLSDASRTRAVGGARGRNRNAGDRSGKSARPRRRDARRAARCRKASRPCRAARQGARFHHQMVGRAGIRSCSTRHRRRSGQ